MLDGTCINIDCILGAGIKEYDTCFKIELICADGVHIFDEYITLEKAERYFVDLINKIQHVHNQLILPSNFLLV